MIQSAILLLAAMATMAPGADLEVRFREQVAPILVHRCLSCHGPKKASAHFRLDTFARLVAGSDAGKSIEPGKPDESLFLDLIVQGEPDGRMPKDADPLPEAEVEILRRWIEQGATSGDLDPDAELSGLVAMANRPNAPTSYRTPVPILALAFRPDGAELAIGGYREVTIWDPSTGRLLRRIPGMAQRTQGLSYNGGGTLLAVAGGTPGESGELVRRARELPMKRTTRPTLTIGAPSYLATACIPRLGEVLGEVQLRAIEAGGTTLRVYAAEDVVQLAITPSPERCRAPG